MGSLHKICEIYVTPPNDSKKVIEMLINPEFLVSGYYDRDGRFKFEVFEKDQIK